VDWVNAYARSIIEPEENILGKARARHKAWRSLGVEHERTISIYPDETWLVEDRLTNWKKKNHSFRLHWLLPDWQWRIEEKAAEIFFMLASPHGALQLRIQSSARPLRVLVARAGAVVHGEGVVKEYEGWFSPTYAQKIPALSVSVEAESAAHVLFSSEFIFPK